MIGFFRRTIFALCSMYLKWLITIGFCQTVKAGSKKQEVHRDALGNKVVQTFTKSCKTLLL